MKIINKIKDWIVLKILSRLYRGSNVYRILRMLYQNSKINLQDFAYKENGIMNWESFELSGESFLVNNFLKKQIGENSTPIFFDIGANNGNYSLLMNKAFQNAKIYAFEPLKVSYKTLTERTNHINNINCFNIGFGSKREKIEIYTNPNISSLSSIYGEVFENIHDHLNQEVHKEFIEIQRLDDFCINNKIDRIHFLKIDTEGHEYEIFKGCKEFIDNKMIDIIQFEFNEMNVISRVFFKDFFMLLNTNYKLFRLHPQKLEEIKKYDTRHEIFKFQNIIAIKR